MGVPAYTILTRRIWLFHHITFIPETSIDKNGLRKNCSTAVKNSTLTKIQPFWNVSKTFFISCFAIQQVARLIRSRHGYFWEEYHSWSYSRSRWNIDQCSRVEPNEFATLQTSAKGDKNAGSIFVLQLHTESAVLAFIVLFVRTF